MVITLGFQFLNIFLSFDLLPVYLLKPPNVMFYFTDMYKGLLLS